MNRTVKGIVLKRTRHSDKSDILTLYTPEEGRIGVACPAPSARRRSFPLLSIIEGTLPSHSRSGISRLGSPSMREPFPSLRSHPGKTAVSLFIADFLDHLLQLQEPEPALWNFIAASLRFFDSSDSGWADFHISFLSRLTRAAGIFPDIESWKPGCIFDMRAGKYLSSLPSHRDIFQGEAARIPLLLSRLSPGHRFHLHLNGSLRYSILEGILRYYSLHLPGMEGVKSHRILSSIF